VRGRNTNTDKQKIAILKALAFLRSQGKRDLIILGFDILDAKLTEATICERCKRPIPPWTACTLIVPSDPLAPPKEVVGRTRGWAFHNSCFDELKHER